MTSLAPGTEVLLALGGGSARGMSHIGVIRALEEAGLVIRGVAGTSIGAVVGGTYCAGALDAYEEFMSAMDKRGVMRMLDPVLPRGGLFAGRRLTDLMQSFVGDVDIEDLAVPFSAVAVDVAGGDELRLTSGRMTSAMRASFGIPGLFTPYLLEVDGQPRWLVDGGIASPVPVAAARALGDLPIVAVNVNRVFGEPAILPSTKAPSSGRFAAFLASDRLPKGARDFLRGAFGSSSKDDDQAGATPAAEDVSGSEVPPETEESTSASLLRRMGFSGAGPDPSRPGLIDSIYSSVVILQHHLARSQFAIEPPALLIEPNMEGVGLFDYQLGAALVAEGERAAREALGGA
ncbi:MAG: patatin-like phospholipase family protein [Planctomycetota bacterium]|nr:patatin-like phospholipase family protein [Planctomycetota bacterium]